MTLSILIPWRSDNGPRQAAWDYLQPLWESTGHEVVVGLDGGVGSFSLAQAVNRAASRATGDVLALYGADHLPDPDLLATIPDALERQSWMPLYGATSYATPNTTRELLAGDIDTTGLAYSATVPACEGVLAVRRAAFDTLGGMDEAFTGWGWEDTAFRLALATVFPIPPNQPNRVLRELWHPPGNRDMTGTNPNWIRYNTRYERAAGEPAAMLTVTNEWRTS